ncbi:hypothetical protein OG21DRAFT_1589706 [Imleria badia]|nr:hypothetical protein OG21DRAFT_1589706 [Imleria badia]
MQELRMTVSFLPRDVATRWNSTLDLLDYALRHRKVVDGVTQRRDLGLRKYEVLDDEWVMMEQLRSVLEVRRNTLFSHDFPNLLTVIPTMDSINKVLTTHAQNMDLSTSVRLAIAIAKKTLN